MFNKQVAFCLALVVSISIVFCSAYAQPVMIFATNYVRWAQVFGVAADDLGEVSGQEMGVYSILRAGGVNMYSNPSNFEMYAATIKMSGTSTISPDKNIGLLYSLVSAFEKGECNVSSKAGIKNAEEDAQEIVQKVIDAVKNETEFFNGEEVFAYESENACYYAFPRMTEKDNDVYMLVLPKE